jgi:hypothetical protein
MSEGAGRSRLRISFVMVGISLVALVVTYATVTIAAAWRAREQMPRLAADSLVKSLRTYHQQTGSFPTNFRELEARVWKHKQAPDFGVDGRQLLLRLLPRGREDLHDLDCPRRAAPRRGCNPLSPAHAGRTQALEGSAAHARRGEEAACCGPAVRRDGAARNDRTAAD